LKYTQAVSKVLSNNDVTLSSTNKHAAHQLSANIN